MKSTMMLSLAAMLSLAVFSVSVDAGQRGMVKVGKSGIFDGTVNETTRRGGIVEGRYTLVGRKVPKGTGANLARDFGVQEIMHGPRDDRTLMERGMDLYSQRDYVPYSGSDLAPRVGQSRSSGYGDCGCGDGGYCPCPSGNCPCGGGTVMLSSWSSSPANYASPQRQTFGSSASGAYVIYGQDGQPAAKIETIGNATLNQLAW